MSDRERERYVIRAAASPDIVLLSDLTFAESLLPPEGEELSADVTRRILSALREAERRTPGGAALHAQLDVVSKWVTLLSQVGEHERFGGSARVRDHVLLQFRLARAAADDYLRETT